MLFVRERETLPEIDPAVPTALIYYREARRRARQQGARVPSQKKTPLERRPATDKKTRIRKVSHWVLNPNTQKTIATPTITPFFFWQNAPKPHKILNSKKEPSASSEPRALCNASTLGGQFGESVRKEMTRERGLGDVSLGFQGLFRLRVSGLRGWALWCGFRCWGFGLDAVI